MMFAIWSFGISNKKRNPQFRKLVAPSLIDVISTCCRTGDLQLTVPCIGQEHGWNMRIPSSGQLPVSCFVADRSMKDDLEEDWAWMLQDSDSYRDSGFLFNSEPFRPLRKISLHSNIQQISLAGF